MTINDAIRVYKQTLSRHIKHHNIRHIDRGYSHRVPREKKALFLCTVDKTDDGNGGLNHGRERGEYVTLTGAGKDRTMQEEKVIQTKDKEIQDLAPEQSS